MKTINLGWTTVAVDGTTEVFIPATGWGDASEVAKLRGNLELRGLTGSNISVAVGYQTANVENSPDAHVVLGSFQTAAGVYFGGSFTDASTNTQAKRLVRFGWVVKLTSAGSLATARVGGTLDVIKPA